LITEKPLPWGLLPHRSAIGKGTGKQPRQIHPLFFIERCSARPESSYPGQFTVQGSEGKGSRCEDCGRRMNHACIWKSEGLYKAFLTILFQTMEAYGDNDPVPSSLSKIIGISGCHSKEESHNIWKVRQPHDRSRRCATDRSGELETGFER